ncbi:immunity 49 family protein [Streptomyces sp. NBC_01294]|uniref:immunity 49 family protein n=1 Tax=Streptomyces sp. NBC_01294 TaxID=2903815 RepID=UPI003FA39582
MATIVSRHFSPGVVEEEWARSLGEDLTEDIGRLERRPHALRRVFNDALLHLGARCTVDPRAAKLETWEATVNALQLGSAIFATASATEGTVECRINRQVRVLPAVDEDQSFTDLGTWLTTFWLAVVCRDQTRITELARFPLDRLHTAGFDEYVLQWVDTLQTYWLQAPGLVEKLTRAVEMSSPEVAVQAPRGLLEAVLAPPINLFYLFVTGHGRLQRGPGTGAGAAQGVLDRRRAASREAGWSSRPGSPGPCVLRLRRQDAGPGRIGLHASPPADPRLARRIPHVRHT